MLANWGYRYNVWKLRRFASAKRIAIVLCFMHAARAETTDAIVEMQDKLITAVHSKARQRYEDLLRATEEARSRAVEILEELGTVVLDDSIPDSELRTAVFARLPSEDIGKLVDGCRTLRAGNEGSHLGLVHHWYGYTRKYSPVFIERTPFQFAEQSPIGRAVLYPLRPLPVALGMPFFHPLSLMSSNKSAFGVNLGQMWHESHMISSWMEILLKGVADGWVRPHVDKSFSAHAGRRGANLYRRAQEHREGSLDDLRTDSLSRDLSVRQALA